MKISTMGIQMDKNDDKLVPQLRWAENINTAMHAEIQLRQGVKFRKSRTGVALDWRLMFRMVPESEN